MTKNDIQYIIGDTLGEALDTVTPLLSVRYITISKLENRFIGIDSLRFKFDMTNEILICYSCHKYLGTIPDTWVLGQQYDTYDGVNYKYMFDEDTLEPYADVYDFSNIVNICPEN